jgi:hypothetical protein
MLTKYNFFHSGVANYIDNKDELIVSEHRGKLSIYSGAILAQRHFTFYPIYLVPPEGQVGYMVHH